MAETDVDTRNWTIDDWKKYALYWVDRCQKLEGQPKNDPSTADRQAVIEKYAERLCPSGGDNADLTHYQDQLSRFADEIGGVEGEIECYSIEYIGILLDGRKKYKIECDMRTSEPMSIDRVNALIASHAPKEYPLYKLEDGKVTQVAPNGVDVERVWGELTFNKYVERLACPECHDVDSERDVDFVGERDQIAKLLAEATKEIERLNDELQAQAECNRDRASEIERLREVLKKALEWFDDTGLLPMLQIEYTSNAYKETVGLIDALRAALNDVQPRVCEWVWDSDEDNTKTSCGDIYFASKDDDYKYCPYCGGLITVKEG